LIIKLYTEKYFVQYNTKRAGLTSYIGEKNMSLLLDIATKIILLFILGKVDKYLTAVEVFALLKCHSVID